MTNLIYHKYAYCSKQTMEFCCYLFNPSEECKIDMNTKKKHIIKSILKYKPPLNCSLILFLINLNSEGKNLKPVAEGSNPGEQGMDIGNVMHVRLITGRPELVVVMHNTTDIADILTVKEIIRRATAVRPEDRPTAEWVVQKLKRLPKV